MRLYAGNLSYDTEEEDLRRAFEPFGEVLFVTIVRDRETGRHRGFGFVEMGDERAAQAAIQGLDQTNLQGRKVVVNLARERGERPRHGGGWRR